MYRKSDMRHRRQDSIEPSLAIMPPVHDHPRGMAGTNSKDLKPVAAQEPEENHESASLTHPRIPLRSCTDVAVGILCTIFIVVYYFVFHEMVFRYVMRRVGAVF